MCDTFSAQEKKEKDAEKHVKKIFKKWNITLEKLRKNGIENG